MWEGLFHVCYIGDTIVRIALRSTFHFCLIRIIFQFISLFPVGSPIVHDKIVSPLVSGKEDKLNATRPAPIVYWGSS